MLLSGMRLGNYQIGEHIARGSVADVYLGMDLTNNRQVALKILREEYSQNRQKVTRFWRGAQKGTHLRHAHIVPIYELGMDNGRYFIAMGYIEGGSVADLLEKYGKLSLEQTAIILTQIASALDFAHERGVIHRDVKPANILLSADGQTAYLADFGIAQVVGHETITDHGTIIGTPEYMSPEQIQGDPVGPASDIYSLGVSVYQMLTGIVPFSGQSVSVLYHQVNSTPAPVSKVNKMLSKAVGDVVSKAMLKDPPKRYAPAAAMASDLRASVHPQRSPAAAWALIALLGLALLLVAFWFIGDNGAPVETAVVTATRSLIVVDNKLSPTFPPTSTLVRLTSTVKAQATATIAARKTATSAPPATPTSRPSAATVVRSSPIPPAAPALVYPVVGQDIRRQESEQTFQWSWPRELKNDEYFILRFFKAGSEDYFEPPGVGWIKETSAYINLAEMENGEYEWVIALVRGDSRRINEVVVQSEKQKFTWGR